MINNQYAQGLNVPYTNAWYNADAYEIVIDKQFTESVSPSSLPVISSSAKSAKMLSKIFNSIKKEKTITSKLDVCPSDIREFSHAVMYYY